MTSKPSPDQLAERARRLGLYGLLTRWQELGDQPWVATLIDGEEVERGRRSLERRIRTSKVGRFRPIADFDWSWPDKIDQPLIEELMQLGFIEEATNVILAGPNGVGKSTIAQNIAHQALLRGHRVLCTTASPPAASAGWRTACSTTTGWPASAPRELLYWSCWPWLPTDTAPPSTAENAWPANSASVDRMSIRR